MVPLVSTEYQFYSPIINCNAFNAKVWLTCLLGPIHNICFPNLWKKCLMEGRFKISRPYPMSLNSTPQPSQSIQLLNQSIFHQVGKQTFSIGPHRYVNQTSGLKALQLIPGDKTETRLKLEGHISSKIRVFSFLIPSFEFLLHRQERYIRIITKIARK